VKSFIKKKEGEKQCRGVIWRQKLTLNHPSLPDEEEEEIRVLTEGSQKGEGK